MRILFYALFISLSWNASGQIVINEISYNPPESGIDSLEYIEIYNAGLSQVDLTGYHFTSGLIDTFPSVNLSPGGYFVTAVSADAMANVFHVQVHEWRSGALANTGESIVLVDALGNFVDSVFFEDSAPWPTEPDGNGPSLELKDTSLDNNDGTNWQFSGGETGVIIEGKEVRGTPGAENSGGGTVGPEIIVNLASLQFDPQHVVIKLGDSLRWLNNEAVPHNVNGTQTEYPDNPESFFSGAPAVGPWIFDNEFNTAGLYNYHCDVHVGSGMNGTVAVYNPDGSTEFPMRHLRLSDNNGQHIFNGVPTTVTGVVHGINFNPDGYSFYIIDELNVGINVFSFDPGTYTVTEGDELSIRGVIDQFNGLLEIIPEEITVLSSGNFLTSPESVEEIREDHEGSHIAMAHYSIDSIVGTDTSGYNVFVTTYLGEKSVIRVDPETGFTLLDIESHNAVRGIGTQFDGSFPFTSGYQLLALEFENAFAVINLDEDAIRMSPNPASEEIKFQSELKIDALALYSLDGKVVKTSNENVSDQLDVSSIHSGIYLIRAFTKEGIWTSKVVIQN